MAASASSGAPAPIGTALSELLCFDLYSASRVVTGLYRRLLADTGLTYPQYLVLVILWKHDALSVKELSDALRLDYSTLTPMLRRMADTGLVTRTRNCADERSMTITLTPAGAAMRARTAHVQPAVAAASGLDPAQIALLQQTLRAFVHSV